MWPLWGPRKRAPKGQNHANLKVPSSSDPEVEQSSYVVFKYLLMWRIKVVHGSSQGGPNGPEEGGGGGAKKYLFHQIQNILWSRGFRIVQMVHMAPWGPWEGPHCFSNWWHTPRCTTGSLRQFRWALSPLGLLLNAHTCLFVCLMFVCFCTRLLNQC